jgi:hypothetical protein
VQVGPEGLYDRTRARHQDPQRIPPELERAILSIPRRLRAHAAPAKRFFLVGATAIHAELKALGVCPRVRADHRVSDVLSDRNSPSLMSRLADVRLQLRENSMMGLGRSAGEAQQGTGSWLGSV